MDTDSDKWGSAMSYDNRHELRDGRVVIYTRNGKPTYHARIRIDGHSGYIIRSTFGTKPAKV